MTFTPLFIIATVALAIAGGVSWRIHQRSRKPRQREGPVPGYSMSHGDEVAFDDAQFELSHPWRLVMVEEFHSPGRSRLVITTRHQGAEDELETFARDVAFDFQSRHHVDVVLVLCRDQAGQLLLHHLYSPDGQAWAGTIARSRLTLDLR